MILKKCVTLQFCTKLLCTELVETYKKIKNGTTIMYQTNIKIVKRQKILVINIHFQVLV